MQPAAAAAAPAEREGHHVDTPPPAEPPVEEPPWRLPAPLHQQGGGLPVAPTAPRIPRALRAFNGMPQAEEEKPAAPPPARGSQRTIRDLLLDNPVEPEEAGLIAGLRSAWRRLRGPAADDDHTET
jgi:hypothetical protein